ncbi:GIY-YIG nuclease family protein [Limosilactobacillus reuteri]|uniref:GIY-YIG nuclease family protein n=1 Tax=Limosilactobacillus reuteri TaxID=1598 RepID=UPI001E59A434|nr:GIY-YIG nuclease family protein [Limosilactobacillus reuteri]MCC4341066.1 GIY-YIG nuclease family protein [Limosilactobacillus reuteri]
MLKLDSNLFQNNKYKYEDIDLTPLVFSSILIYLFDGKRFKRQDAIDKIRDFHRKNGGKLQKVSYVSTFKRSCEKLKPYIKNLSYGIWQLNFRKKYIESVEKVEPKRRVEKDNTLHTAQETIGTGKEAIYVYYYKTYKKYALLKNKNTWPCKIGKTRNNVSERILSQLGTAYPEYPIIGLEIRCSSATKLEKAIHSILKYKNKAISNSPGKEWYNTNPSEIQHIYSILK